MGGEGERKEGRRRSVRRKGEGDSKKEKRTRGEGKSKMEGRRRRIRKKGGEGE